MSPRIIFLVHILKVHMYIFTPIFFKIQEIYVISQLPYLVFLFRVQVGVYGYEWVRMGTMVYNNGNNR